MNVLRYLSKDAAGQHFISRENTIYEIWLRLLCNYKKNNADSAEMR
ncbi:hypothetical protein BN3456_01179 [Clostridium sp. C105KSO13]|nr:hypothetical protein BN3456_01179 [Clostridium sp. C105KSO13]